MRWPEMTLLPCLEAAPFQQGAIPNSSFVSFCFTLLTMPIHVRNFAQRAAYSAAIPAMTAAKEQDMGWVRVRPAVTCCLVAAEKPHRLGGAGRVSAADMSIARASSIFSSFYFSFSFSSFSSFLLFLFPPPPLSSSSSFSYPKARPNASSPPSRTRAPVWHRFSPPTGKTMLPASSHKTLMVGRHAGKGRRALKRGAHCNGRWAIGLWRRLCVSVKGEPPM
ncbi:hypothetical protein IF2G_04571 [Cordyceps javanica]|nr:hypothetical protein IF2G_04571 [Cordyceps javanica]